jgi:hypothetical protein
MPIPSCTRRGRLPWGNLQPPSTSVRLNPPFPETPDHLDLNLRFVTDLALETLSADATCTTARVSERMKPDLVVAETECK